MIFQTNNLSEKMRITSSGLFGLGTDSPSDLLELSGTTAQPAIRLTDADVSGLYHRIFTPTNTGLAISADTGNVAADSFVRFDVDGAERMRVDSSGNVGIGTSSPDKLLHIAASSNPTFRIENTDTTAAVNQSIGKIEFEGQDSSTNASGVRALIDAQYSGVGGQGRFVFQLAQENSASLSDSVKLNYSTQQFFTNNTEAMRIDSSGNLLVGKTAASGSTEGAELRADGRLLAVSTSDFAGYFNRKTTDGEIVRFVKDTTTIGNIGSYSTDRLYIADQSNGLQFDQAVIRPCDNTGANTDDVVTLGSSGSRFKDAHFSGTVNANAFVGDGSGLTGVGGGGVLITNFTSSGSFSKNADSKYIIFMALGGGGGGAGGMGGGGFQEGGSGGSGAGCHVRQYYASAVDSTVTVVIGAGGSGGGNSNNGSAGGTSQVHRVNETEFPYVQGGGGGGGLRQDIGPSGGGFTVGGSGTSTNGFGGYITKSNGDTTVAFGLQGGRAQALNSSNQGGGAAEYGGGGGGGCGQGGNNGNGNNGGSSYYGGAGGGGGGYKDGSSTNYTGGSGGSSGRPATDLSEIDGSRSGGGGGGGNGNSGVNGTNGANQVFWSIAGTGGGGGSSANPSGTGGNGGTGGYGCGGGAGGAGSSGGTGGAGGQGYVKIIEILG
jgi:hypothetical protein